MNLKLGVTIEDTWAFFREIYQDLFDTYETSLFKKRVYNQSILNEQINAYLLRHDLQAFIQSVDVLFSEWASGLLVVASHLEKNCKIITRLHRYEMYQWVDRINWDNIDRVILVSNAKQGEFAHRFPKQASKTVVIPEAVSLERFKPIKREFQGDIGILCHLTPRKRVYELILAFYELIQIQDGFHLHIGGGTRSRFLDYPEALNQLVNRLGLQEKVTFYGNVTNPESWYQTIDIFVSNSYSEGLQVSPIEAIASGCYCLSHWWDGADELLPLENLYHTDSQFIQRVLSYSALSESKKNYQKEKIRCLVHENFNVEKVKHQIRQVIEEVAENSVH